MTYNTMLTEKSGLTLKGRILQFNYFFLTITCIYHIIYFYNYFECDIKSSQKARFFDESKIKY